MTKFLAAFLAFLAFYSGSCAGKTNRDDSAGSSTTGNASTVIWEALPQVKSAAFIDSKLAWLVTTEGNILYTYDAGSYWATVGDKVIRDIKCVSFIDSKNGWVVNEEGRVWQTINGGEEWSEIGNVVGKERNFNSPKQMLFADKLHGWILDMFAVWCTDNGGETWKRCLSLDSKQDNDWQPIHASSINASTVWVSSTNGIIHHTRDGGKSWRTQTVLPGSDIRAIHFINEDTGWITGSPLAGIHRTDDGGSNWQQQLSGVNILSIYFLNINEGWAVGKQARDKSKPSGGVILHTIDGGRKWQPILIGENEPFFNQVYFTDNSHGWLFARDNTYRTDDGGKSWSLVLKLPPIKNADVDSN